MSGFDAFAVACEAAGLPAPLKEHRFAPPRKWRIDYFFPPDLAVELEGGAWVGGRHNRPTGYLKDVEKYNALTLAGIRLIRVTPKMVKSGEALALVEKALKGEPNG